MAITQARPIDYFHLGVRGVIEGDPDGLFSFDNPVVHDASGGLVSFAFHYGNVTTGPNKLDVLMRLNWLHLHGVGATVTNLRCSLTKTLPWFGGAERVIFGPDESSGGDLAADENAHVEFINGLWVFPQKGDSQFLEFVSTNVNGATLTMTGQGYFWYMGRLRRRVMENPIP